MNKIIKILNNLIKKEKQIKWHNMLQAAFVALLVFSCAISKELRFAEWIIEGVHRTYGSALAITIPDFITICCLILHSSKICKIKIRTSILLYFLFGIFSVVFIYFTGAPFELYIIAGVKYFLYILLYVLLINIKSSMLLKGINLGFIISTIYQTLAGLVYQFTQILIPFAFEPKGMRSGVYRMIGTLQSPGAFSLYMSILALYFLSQILFSKKYKLIIFLLICYIDIFLSGSRAMIIACYGISMILVIVKFWKEKIVKATFILSILMFAFYFIKSDIFYNLFVEHNFINMFEARLSHCVIAFKIITTNLKNMFFGVGLNNCVDYIRNNYYILKLNEIVDKSIILTKDFAKTNPIHNSFLLVGCELGIIGMAIYINVFLSQFKNGFNVLKYKNKRSIGLFILSSCILIVIYCLQGWAAHQNSSWVLIIILFSIADSQIDKGQIEAK